MPDARILRILGDGASEATGSMLWIDDVTGDGLGDLLIARQNFTPDAGRIGAGALTIIAGGDALRTLAAAGTPIDLRAPPPELAVTTVIGVAQTARLGTWIRTGDVTGDGIADVAVGADQESSAGRDAPRRRLPAARRRAARRDADDRSRRVRQRVVSARRGRRAAASARRRRPSSTSAAPARSPISTATAAPSCSPPRRSRASARDLSPPAQPAGSAHASGGAPDGALYIAWDENFAGEAWDSLDLAIGDPGVVATSIHGGDANVRFGEEITGGRDFDGDGAADLFVGDLVGNAPGRPAASGLGTLLSGVDDLRGADFDLDAPPSNVAITTLRRCARRRDRRRHRRSSGDFDGDGRADLAFSSPHAWPLGRVQAGVLHVFHGRDGAWPALVDLSERRAAAGVVAAHDPDSRRARGRRATTAATRSPTAPRSATSMTTASRISS